MIALLQLAQSNPEAILNHHSKEMFDAGKNYVKNGVMPEDLTLADIGALEFFASYCAGGFIKGYGWQAHSRENMFEERRNNLIAQAPRLRDITFECKDYRTLPDQYNTVIYCDPPYANTTQYGYKKDRFTDYDTFWQKMRDWSVHNYVYISEQVAPDDFIAIWQKEGISSMNQQNKSKMTEHLFIYKDGIANE